MKIFSRIIKNLFIVLGVGIAAVGVMLFVMYFFNVSIFGYVFANTEIKEPITRVVAEGVSHIEVVAPGFPVNIVAGSEDKIIVNDNMQGIVRRRASFYDAAKKTARVEVTDAVVGDRLTIKILEPKKLIAFYGGSSVTIMLTKDRLEQTSFTITTGGSNVFAEAGHTLKHVNFNSTGGGSLKIESDVLNLQAETVGGHIEVAGSILQDIKVYTKHANIKLKDVYGDAYIKASNSYVVFNEIKGNLQYNGYIKQSEAVYQDIDAKGGKIVGEKANDVQIKTSYIDVQFAQVSGNFILTSSNRATVKTGRLLAGASADISTKSGGIKFDNIESVSFKANTTTGYINAAFSSQNIAAHAELATDSGNITVTGAVAATADSSTLIYHQGELNVNTVRGKIFADKIGCKLTASASKGGNIKAVFHSGVVSETSLQTERGNIEAIFETGTKCWLIAIAKTRVMNLSSQHEFEELGRPTPIFNATQEDTRIISLRAPIGKISIGEFWQL